MRKLLETSEVPTYLDEVAKRFLAEARSNYAERRLSNTFMLDQGREILLLTWLGDAANEALACLLSSRGLSASAGGPGIEVIKGHHTNEDILTCLFAIGAEDPPPVDILLADAKNLQREKWDWALPDNLLRKSYSSLYLDIDEALAWIRGLDQSAKLRMFELDP
jgi:ATP-dependent Lhr-like helicase